MWVALDQQCGPATSSCDAHAHKDECQCGHVCCFHEEFDRHGHGGKEELRERNKREAIVVVVEC